MRDQFGPAIVMERLLHDIEAAVEHNHVVIDGLRQIEELERLQSSQPRMIVIAVEASESHRRERINSRLRSDDGNFDEREAREWGWGLEMVMQLADLTIKNDGTEDDFTASIIHSLHSIGVE
jgi:dephospho-CoA kinase